MNAITKTEEVGNVADYSASLLEVISKAARDPNVDIDKMERLLQMQERVQTRDAESAFNAAFSAMQPHLPHITVKNKIVHSGRVISEYADWPSISKAITPVLSDYGFSLNFGGSNTATEKTTIAKLRHIGGHVETNEVNLPHDTSGSKNKVQAIGSSSTYGQRYSACPLVGVVVHGEDDDGAAAGATALPQGIQDADIETIMQLGQAVGGDQVTAICAAYSVGGVSDLTAKQAKAVVKKLNEKLAAKAAAEKSNG